MFKDLCKTQITFSSIKEFRQLHLLDSKRKIAIFCSNSTCKIFDLEYFLNKQNVFIYDRISPNPNQISILDCFYALENFKPDCIYAIGGGSVIDLAKAYLAFYLHSELSESKITLYLNHQTIIDSRPCDFIAVPTTAGTGSEVTQWATIWDYYSPKKFSIDHELLKPNEAIIIPEVILSAPNDLILSTGFDALSHACEAFWAKTTNPIIRQLSILSMKLLTKNLKSFLDCRTLECAENLFLGSLIAGIAFSQTKTTAAHAISYPLTQLFNVPHGFAVALTLGEIAEFNFKNAKIERISEFQEIFQCFGGLKGYIKKTSHPIRLISLQEFNIKKEDIHTIAKNAFNKERMANNPVELSFSDIVEILNKVY